MTLPTHTTAWPPFSLASPLGTDIWRKPPAIDVFSAPTYPESLPHYSLKSFQRARFTVSLPPCKELRQFDQAGLVLHFTNPQANITKGSGKDRWIKTGIEFFNGKPLVGTAACDTWSDWSVAPLRLASEADRPSVTIEVQREKDQLGKSLWIYQVIRDSNGEEERIPLRECNWVFAEEDGWEVGVGAYVARETEGEGKDELTGHFEDGLEVEVLKNSDGC